MISFSPFCRLLWLLVSLVVSTRADHTALRWASSGGGWRAMVTDMAYANLFAQAGLFDNSSSMFDAISSTSGGSWFTTQFFYSPQFYQKTLSSPQVLHDFVLQWMQAYQAYSATALTFAQCAQIALLPGGLSEDYCNMLATNGGMWANFTSNMLQAVSTNYSDSGFVQRVANAQNRVAALQSTDLLIQMGLAPNARTGLTTTSSGTVTYLKPKGSTGPLYAVPIATQFAIKTAGTSFNYALPSTSLPMETATSPAPAAFSFANWTDFYMFPGQGGDVTTASDASPNTTDTGSSFKVPFGGNPTTAQLAAATSASAAALSGGVPSSFAQGFSRQSFLILSSSLNATDKATQMAGLLQVANIIYTLALSDGLAVCTQWPNTCGNTDGRMMDGGFADGPSLAQNIAQYQASGADMSNTTLKVILANNIYYTDRLTNVLMYFNTTFNQGVSPGSFYWPPSMVAGEVAQSFPVLSTQIFEDYLDIGTYYSAMTLTSTNVSAGTFMVTTVDNPAFGVTAGLKVELLVLQTNSSDIPTSIVGATDVGTWTMPLAALAESIASSSDLLAIIKTFATDEVAGTSASPDLGLGWLKSSGFFFGFVLVMQALW